MEVWMEEQHGRNRWVDNTGSSNVDDRVVSGGEPTTRFLPGQTDERMDQVYKPVPPACVHHWTLPWREWNFL